MVLLNALPTSGIVGTAANLWEAVYELVGSLPGRTVFVNGGTTATGISAIQMVITAASGKFPAPTVVVINTH